MISPRHVRRCGENAREARDLAMHGTHKHNACMCMSMRVHAPSFAPMHMHL